MEITKVIFEFGVRTLTIDQPEAGDLEFAQKLIKEHAPEDKSFTLRHNMTIITAIQEGETNNKDEEITKLREYKETTEHSLIMLELARQCTKQEIARKDAEITRLKEERQILDNEVGARIKREQEQSRSIDNFMDRIAQQDKIIEALKFTIDTLCKAIDTQRETIQKKDKELADLNAEIDRIAKESRHPGRYCCHIPCNKEAEYVVYFGAGHEDYTEVCADHLAETIRDVEEYTVYPLQGPGEKGEDKEPELFICPDAEKCNVKDCRARNPHKWESGACEITNWCFSGQRSGPCIPVKDPESPAPQEEIVAAEHIPVLFVKITNPSGDDVKEAGEVLKHMRWNFEIVRTNLRDCPGSKKEEK